MAGDHGLEVEIAFGRVGRALHVHGEMAACRKDADIGFVEIAHPVHVGHDRGIAGDIDGVALGHKHIADFGACGLGAVGGGEGRAMRGGDHRQRHAFAKRHRATLVEADRVEVFVFVPVGHHIILADNRHPELARKWQDIGDMVEMRVRQDEVGCPGHGFVVTVLGQDRVAGQPRVDEQNEV